MTTQFATFVSFVSFVFKLLDVSADAILAKVPTLASRVEERSDFHQNGVTATQLSNRHPHRAERWKSLRASTVPNFAYPSDKTITSVVATSAGLLSPSISIVLSFVISVRPGPLSSSDTIRTRFRTRAPHFTGVRNRTRSSP